MARPAVSGVEMRRRTQTEDEPTARPRRPNETVWHGSDKQGRLADRDDPIATSLFPVCVPHAHRGHRCRLRRRKSSTSDHAGPPAATQPPFAAYVLLVEAADHTPIPFARVIVQHDANHGAYSSRPWVNRLFSCSLDLMGVSSFIWRQKHNVIHHTFTNINGIDGDLDFGPVARLTSKQRWYPWHRYQHLYCWLAYGSLLWKWVLVRSLRGGRRVSDPSRRRRHRPGMGRAPNGYDRGFWAR